MSNRVRKANKVSSADLYKSIHGIVNPRARSYTFAVALSSELSKDTRNALWQIYEETMHDLVANSSFGWDPPTKKLELFHVQTRFILVHDFTNTLVGFSSFRFEREEDENAVYCYELQLSQTSQRQGLGRALVDQLTAIGRKHHMQKILLTALKANTSAIKFYHANGFQLDPCSPDYVDPDDSPDSDTEQEPVDYQILSKTLEVVRD